MIYDRLITHLWSPHEIVLIVLGKPKSDFSVAFWISSNIAFKYNPKWKNILISYATDSPICFNKARSEEFAHSFVRIASACTWVFPFNPAILSFDLSDPLSVRKMCRSRALDNFQKDKQFQKYVDLFESLI